MEKLIPAAKKYGAMFILLPLSDQGLPENIEEKKEIIHKILQHAGKYGLSERDIIVDGLVATIGANKKAALEAECYVCISYGGEAALRRAQEVVRDDSTD